MAMPGENMEKEEPLEQPGKEEPSSDNIDESKLTYTKVKNVEDGKVTINDLAREHMQHEAAAKAELNKLVTATPEDENVITLKEYREFKKEIDDTKSPEKMRELLERIQDIPRQKEEEKAQDEEDSKELDPEDPKLQKLQKEFNRICEENKDLIGLKQVPGFKAWFVQERKKQPTVKHLKQIIKRLKGKEITDRDGLAPRREEYKTLTQLFKKYKLSSPQESEWIKVEGLSERQKFRRNAEELENHLDNVKDTGFYSKEMIQKTMKEMLLAKNPEEQKKAITTAKNIARKESETFTHLDSKMTVGGVTIRKMSEASKRKYMEYYKTTDFKEREKLVNNWQKLVENEAALAKELEKIYKDNPEGLKLALGSFEELDYMEKEKALKEHERLVKKETDKEKLETTLTIKTACAKIDAAAQKKIIAASTQKKWKEWFKSDKAERDPDTGNRTGLEVLKKHYEILTSSTPNAEFKNISAYKVKRDRFTNTLKEWRRTNPDIKEKEIQKWQDKYDKESWTGRKKVYKDFRKEQEKADKEYKKRKAMEKEIGVEEKDKETVEVSESLKETIKRAQELMRENQNEEALVVLERYWLANRETLTDEENNEINFWKKVAIEKMKEFGRGKRLEVTTEKEVEEELKRMAEEDKAIKNQLEEENIKTLNLEGTQQSEDRHQRKIDAQERAKKESLSRTEDGSLEQDLTEDFYEQTDKEHILDEEGTGEEIEELKFKEADMIVQERQRLKEKTRQKQAKLYKKEGFTHIKLKDKTGRQISTEEAKAEQKKDLEKLGQEMAQKAEKKVKGKKGTEVFDLNAKIAARRKASKVIEKERHRKDKLKAA